MEIKKLSQAVGSGNFVLYGPSGAGKTYSLSTLPGRTLILAVEKGLRTLVEIAPDVDVAEINSMQDMRDVFEHLIESPDKYETVVVDSLSELGEYALNEAKEETRDGRQQYGLMADKISGLIRSFNEVLPQTVIFTAQEERVNNEDLGLLDYVYAPCLPGRKFATSVPYRFDFVFCLRTKKNDEGVIERRFQTGAHGDYLAKARTQRLEVFEEANWTHILNKLKGDK